ncbi:MAG: helicase HerA-like domain-containing protein, partial [Mycobacterium sp.]
MSSESTPRKESATTPAQQIAAGYAFQGQALELGTVVVDSATDPAAQIRIPLATVNRHGLVAGATGTGKTKTLQLIAEQLSAAGVPVLMADVKGDLSGLARAGETNDKVTARAKETGEKWEATAFPVEFLSLGTDGIGVPVRATIASFGPI